MSDPRNLLILLSVLAGYLFCQTLAETCKMSGPCSCDFSNWKLDLSPLIVSMKDSEPTFTTSVETGIYNYNPCKPFLSKANGCINKTDLAVNHINKDGICEVVGIQKGVVFKGDISTAEGLYLEYTNEDLPKSSAKVFLKCSKAKAFKFVKQESTNPAVYVFTLETVYACPTSKSQIKCWLCFAYTVQAYIKMIFNTHRLGVKIVTVAVTIYLIGGFLFKHFYLHAQGVEIIPHYSFWSDFPLLVRDGCYFALRGCQGPSTYERI